MKSTVKSFGFKLWSAFIFFAAIIFAVLWLLQTVFLQTFYTGMAISSLKKTASEITAQQNTENFFTVIDEAAQNHSLLIFLTDPDGEVLYSADAYSSLYMDTTYSGGQNHSEGNPYLSDNS
ncbi:MAG: sensor histidine kinase, partial [Butyricicoccus sp.]